MSGDENDKAQARTLAGSLMADKSVAVPSCVNGEKTDNGSKTTSGNPFTDDKNPPRASSGKSVNEPDKQSSDDTVQTHSTNEEQDDPSKARNGGTDSAESVAILSSSKQAKLPYVYDPGKITLRFLFANRDGLSVTIECRLTDTVGEVKGTLLSMWPGGKKSTVRVGYKCWI